MIHKGAPTVQQSRFAARRFREHGGLFGTIAAVALVLTFLLSGTMGFISSSATLGVRQTLLNSSATDAAVRAEIRLTDDAAGQSTAVMGVIADAFGSAPVDVYRTVRAAPQEAVLPDQTVTSVIVSSDAELDRHAHLDDGEWATAGSTPIEATVQSGAAETLGLRVGDEVQVGEADEALTITISGIWSALDDSEAYWFGDSQVATGEDDSSFGPFNIDEADFAAFLTTPLARWTVVPDPQRVISAQLRQLSDGASTLETRLRDEPGLASSGVIFEGGLGATLTSLERGTDAVRGVLPVPVVLLGVIGAMAIAQLARLLGTARATETALLRARGASVGQLTRSSVLEALAVAVIPAAVGAASALLIASALGGGMPQLFDAAVTAASVAVFVIASIGFVGWRAATSVSRRDRAVASGRTTRAATIASVVFAVAAAAISIWQLRLYGSPLVANASGERLIDPIAVLAPTISLLACAVVSLAVFGPIAAAAERASSAVLGVAGPLAARQVARRLGVFAVPVLLVSLSVGGTTVAAAYSDTWNGVNASAGELRNGGDVRILTASGSIGGPATLPSSAPFAEIEGVDAATPVLTVDVELGGQIVSLVALDPVAIEPVMNDLRGELDTELLSTSIGDSPLGLEIPAGSTELTVTAGTTVTIAGPRSPGQGDTELAVWISDKQGALARLALEPLDDTFVGELPTGVEPWTILAVDVAISSGAVNANYDFRVDSISANGLDVPLTAVEDWDYQPDAFAEAPGEVTATTTDAAFSATDLEPIQSQAFRLMPASGSGSAVNPVPVVVTTALAELIGLVAGDAATLEFADSGRAIEVEIADDVDLLPGTEGSWGAVASLQLVNDQLLRTSNSIPRPDQFWLSTTEPQAVASAARSIAPEGANVTTVRSGSGDELLLAAAIGLWIGAVGGLALAATAVWAVVGALARSRVGEVAVLRVLGLSRSQQVTGRRRELFLVTAFAAVLGALSGVLVSALVIPDLAKSAVLGAPAILPAPLQFAVLPWLCAIAAFGMVLAAVGWAYGRAVGRQASTVTPRDASL